MEMKNKRLILVVTALMILLFIGTYQVVYGGWINCHQACLDAGHSDSECCTLVSDGGGGNPTPTETSTPPPTPTPDPKVVAAEEAAKEAAQAQSNAEAALQEAYQSGNPNAIAQAQAAVAAASANATTAQNNLNQAVATSQANAGLAAGSQGAVNGGTNGANTPATGIDPVNIATGIFTTGETDLSYQAGNMTIKAQRKYQNDQTGGHSFGPGWSFNYDTRIIMGVKPNAEAEALFMERQYNDANKLYQERLAAYDASLAQLDTALQEARQAQSLAATAVAEAQEAVAKANQTNRPDLKQQANTFLQQAQNTKTRADAQLTTVSQARQDLVNGYSDIRSIYQVGLDLQDLAAQARREAALAVSNQTKNNYTVNTSDPANQQYTGNNTLTLIDEAGVPHLYLINTPPDYTSTAIYLNGQPNYYPQGATLSSGLPTDDRMELLADGGYKLTRRDRTIYLYSFYGQLAGIIDPNGNKLQFLYSPAHQLAQVVDDFGRSLNIERQNGKIVKLTDPKGRTYRYTYDSKGLLSSRTDADGATIGYRYEGGLLVENVKPDGSSYKFLYAEVNGRKVVDYTEDEEGNRETFIYCPDGMYSEYTNASGVWERHYYNERYLETRVAYLDGSFVEMAYDDDNNLTSYRDQLGQVFRYSYDGNRNLTQAIDPEGKTESWTYNEFNKITSYMDKMGNTTCFTYDQKGNLSSVNYPDDSSVLYNYNSLGQVTEFTDQLQNKTLLTYDANGYVAAVKDPEGNWEQFENDSVGNLMKYTDPAGNVTRYEYNGDGKATRITDSLGHVQCFTYNLRQDLVQKTDWNGNVTSFEYDRRHLLLKVTNPLGEVTEYLYRDDQKPVEKISGGVNHTTYTYDLRGNLIAVAQVETGAVTRYEYNRAGQITALIDPNGAQTEYSYNGLGSLVRVKDPAGNTKTYEYNASQKLISVTDELGFRTGFEYDRMNRLTRITDPNGNAERYGYDLKGNLNAVTDKNGNITEYQYNRSGQLVKAIDPLGNYDSWVYDSRGLPVAKADKLGNRTLYDYDSLQRLNKVTDPLGGMKRYTYDPNGNLVSKTDENGVITTFSYDALNRLTVATDALGNRSRYQYNYLGLVTKKIDALNQETSFDYNESGKLVKITDAIGAAQNFEYDKNGNLVKETDPAGNSVRYTYDSMNRLIEQIDALNQKTGYRYDPKGNLTQLVNPKNDTYSFEYDAADRLVREVNFLGASQRYLLDANGNVTSKMEFNGQTTLNHYDALNRLTEVDYPDATRKQFVYDTVGNLTQAVNENATEKYYYNALSWLIKAETLNFGATGETKTVEFTYDKVGNPLSMTTATYGPERKISYQYDNLNRLVKATLPDKGLVEFKYDALNRIVERINPNNTSTVYGYTPRSEVASIVNYVDRNHSKVLESYGYLYNAKGERTFQLEGNGDLTAYQYDPTGRLSEVYYPFRDSKKTEDLKERTYFGMSGVSGRDIDSMNQSPVSYLNIASGDQQQLNNLYLKIRQNGSAINPWKGFWREAFTYDSNGNITMKSNSWGNINYQYNAGNQLIKAGNRSYQYDLNGNLIREALGGKYAEYQYNYDNRLTQVTSPFKGLLSDDSEFTGKVKYAYDALGRKVRKERQGTDSAKIDRNYYIYDGLGLDVIAEFQTTVKVNNPAPGGELELVNEYYYGNNQLLAMKQIDHPEKAVTKGPLDGVSVYHQDVLGSVTLITGANGQVIEKYAYDAFGKAYEGTFAEENPGVERSKSYKNGNVYGFTGQRFETELGVYEFAFRDYNPVVKRWMTVDPIKDGLNWYQYCSSDPINFIDPLGMDAVTLFLPVLIDANNSDSGQKDQKNNQDIHQTIVDTAKTYIGDTYGHSVRPFDEDNKDNIVDCSELTYRSYKAANITIPQTANEQYEFFQDKGWLQSDPKKAQVGDIAFFTEPGEDEVTHVGIVSEVNAETGEIKYIHAPGTDKPVEEKDWKSMMSPYYSTHFVAFGHVCENNL